MFKEISILINQNKNIIMLISAGIYIFSLIGIFTSNAILFGIILTLILIFCTLKNIFPFKLIILWALIFYFGVFNTNMRIKDSDALLNLAPKNAEITGKIISIPQIKDERSTKFYFDVNSIEFDGKKQDFKKEKVLVSLEKTADLKIYETYRIRGRLSIPFKSSNPSQFDYGDYLRNFGSYAVFYGHNPYEMRNSNEPCYKKLDVEPSLKEKLLISINNYRDNIITIHSKYLKSPNLEILGGIIFGDDAVNPPENIRQSFINSGLLHILAASGMNVAFIFSFFFFLFNIFRMPYKLNISACIGAVSVYVFMTGLGASVIRAALMLIFVLIGKLIDRDANSIALLSFVALIMLIYNPMYLNNVGFQLSFVVTFGILLMMPILIKSKNKLLAWIIGNLTVPVVAQLWVVPIQIFYFNNISVYSVFANILSIPFLEIISPCGFISSMLAGINHVGDFICKYADFILNPLISAVVNISDFFGKLPYSTVQTTHPNIFQILLYYSILLSLVFLLTEEIRKKFGKLLKIILPLFVCILIVSNIHLPNHNLEITAFDVGNADAFFIKTPDNKYFLIDTGKSGYNGGKSQAEFIILKYLKDTGIKNIEGIIVTHFDNDHCGGTVDLLKGLRVKTLYVNSLNHNSEQAKDIYRTAKEVRTEILEGKNKQIVFDHNNLKMTNLVSDDNGIGDNENSINTLLTYGKFSMLFTGDSGVDTFNKIHSSLPKNITVLKVGHHGASGVVNKNMAEYLNPKISLISTGENKFGHPSIYTISILENSKILRTDIDNSVKFVINEKDYKIYTYDYKKRNFAKLKI